MSGSRLKGDFHTAKEIDAIIRGQREQLDACLARYDDVSKQMNTLDSRRREQIATLTAERDEAHRIACVILGEVADLTAANKSLDAHCMVLQHDIQTMLAENEALQADILYMAREAGNEMPPDEALAKLRAARIESEEA